MASRYQDLQSKFEDQEHVFGRKLKVVEERAKVEMKKNKDAWAASEKVRRD